MGGNEFRRKTGWGGLGLEQKRVELVGPWIKNLAFTTLNNFDEINLNLLVYQLTIIYCYSVQSLKTKCNIDDDNSLTLKLKPRLHT